MDAALKLPGSSTIYKFLLEESNNQSCLPEIKKGILSIIENINTLCVNNKCASLVNKDFVEFKKQIQLQEEEHNKVIKHSHDFEQNYVVGVHALPDTYHIIPGFFWTTVDYISENPGKIILGMLLTSVLIAGITLIALGSCGIGLEGLCAAGTAILGAGLTGASVCGYGGLLGYSLFSNSENKSLSVEDDMNRLELYAVTI